MRGEPFDLLSFLGMVAVTVAVLLVLSLNRAFGERESSKAPPLLPPEDDDA